MSAGSPEREPLSARERLSGLLRWAAVGLGCASAASLLLQAGFARGGLEALDVFLAAGFVCVWLAELAQAKLPAEALRRRNVELAVLAGFLVCLAVLLLLPRPLVHELEAGLHHQVGELGFFLLRLFLFLCVSLQLLRAAERVLAAGIRAEFLLAGSFLLIIVLGGLLLLLPAASARPEAPIGLVDAFFTATSAVCVTGLAVRDTGGDFSVSGQTVIAVLIQIGGLGIVTFVALLSSLSNKALPVPQMVAFRHLINAPEIGDLRRRVIGIVAITFAVEGLGALMLFRWADPAMAGMDRIGWAVFHSVSAFCNAGFALHPSSLEFAVRDPGINVTIMLLIIAGGLGFLVIPEILAAFWIGGRELLPERLFRTGKPGLRWPKFSVQTRLSLWVTGALIVAGTLGIWLIESDRLLGGFGTFDAVMASAFQSVTARTAGFNTLSVGGLQNATLLLIMFLMVIGGSPVSTAGGIKTVTFGILILGLKALVTGKDRIEVFGRTLPTRAIFSALNVFVLYAVSATAGLVAVSLFDPGVALRDSGFEVVSALSTVGLSTGITAGLSPGSKIVLCALMFIGRIGPIALVLSVFQARARIAYDFPDEDVVVG